MENGEVIYEKVYASSRPPPKISLKHDWMKELGPEVTEGGKDFQRTKPKTKYFKTVRFVNSCMSVSAERLDQEKDADEKVDADHVRTVRPVESEQSIGLFTQCEERDFDFRVSGLSRAVLKEVEIFRVRELVEKI